MSTIAPPQPAPSPELQVMPHTKVVGSTRFWCIQPECDGKHHFYCSCAR